MKITRRQLRRLIETRIKPAVPPKLSGDRALGNLDDMIRDPKYRDEYDDVARTLGYPKDRSYADDLASYDAAGRVTIDTPLITLGHPNRYTRIEQVPIPYELIDELIRRYERAIELEAQGIRPYDMGRDAHTFRKAGYAVTGHIDEYLDNKYGENGYELDVYGYKGASGYRAEEYVDAMSRWGEYL